jgi:hypothetical protein
MHDQRKKIIIVYYKEERSNYERNWEMGGNKSAAVGERKQKLSGLFLLICNFSHFLSYTAI